MNIGFLSGDVVELTDTRKGVSVPDYPVQGGLLRRLRARGHQIVLFTRPPVGTPTEALDGVVEYIDRRESVNAFECDVLLCDRLGSYGALFEEAMEVLEAYCGPVVYHQYVGYPGWAPPFREMPWLLSIEKPWTIVNRASDPYEGYMAMAGYREHIGEHAAAWARWEPFFMDDYPWQKAPTPPRTNGRPYRQGYYGRLPKREHRAQLAVRYLSKIDWPRVVYGPHTSTAWASAKSGAQNGGRVEYAGLPEALARFDAIVQVPHDRFGGKGRLDIWPNRIGECALAGVLQLFDRGYGLRALREWEIQHPDELVQMRDKLEDTEWVTEQVELQRKAILVRVNAERTMDIFEDILRRAAGLSKAAA